MPILITIRNPLIIWHGPQEDYTLWSTKQRWQAVDGSLHRTRREALKR